MTFNEYLTSKKINPEAFKTWNLTQYQEWEQAFAQYHPDSFTMQFIRCLKLLQVLMICPINRL